MVCRNFTERGPVPQSSGAPVSPDRHAGPPPPARRPVPLLACHPAGSQGHSQRVLASPFPNLSVAGALAGPIPIARMPAAARPDVTRRSLERPADHRPWTQARLIRLPDPLEGLLPTHGQAWGLTAARECHNPRWFKSSGLEGSRPDPTGGRKCPFVCEPRAVVGARHGVPPDLAVDPQGEAAHPEPQVNQEPIVSARAHGGGDGLCRGGSRRWGMPGGSWLRQRVRTSGPAHREGLGRERAWLPRQIVRARASEGGGVSCGLTTGESPVTHKETPAGQCLPGPERR